MANMYPSMMPRPASQVQMAPRELAPPSMMGPWQLNPRRPGLEMFMDVLPGFGPGLDYEDYAEAQRSRYRNDLSQALAESQNDLAGRQSQQQSLWANVVRGDNPNATPGNPAKAGYVRVPAGQTIQSNFLPQPPMSLLDLLLNQQWQMGQDARMIPRNQLKPTGGW